MPHIKQYVYISIILLIFSLRLWNRVPPANNLAVSIHISCFGPYDKVIHQLRLKFNRLTCIQFSLAQDTSEEAILVEKHGFRFMHVPGTWQRKHNTMSSDEVCPDDDGVRHPFDIHGCCHQKKKFNETLVFSSGMNVRRAMEHFLKAIRGRNLLFVGDSLTLQNFAGFLMVFKSYKVAMVFRDNKSFSWTKNVFLPDYNTSLQLIEFYSLASVNGTVASTGRPDPPKYILTDDDLKTALYNSDTIITNIGLHYAFDTGYQWRMMNHIQQMMNEEKHRRNICFMWRSTLPQHFANRERNGLYDFHYKRQNETSCSPLSKKWSHPSDGVLDHVRAATNTPLIDMTSILEQAFFFHSLKDGDCSHFCYSQYLFAPFFTVFAETIRQSC